MSVRPLVGWLVRHTFEFPLPMNIFVQQLSLMTPLPPFFSWLTCCCTWWPTRWPAWPPTWGPTWWQTRWPTWRATKEILKRNLLDDMLLHMGVGEVVDMLLHMVADKVAGMVADMGAKKNCSWMTWSWTWWPTRR